MDEPVLSISLSIKHILPLEIIMNDQISFEIIQYKHYMKEHLSYKLLYPFKSYFTFQSRGLKHGISLSLLAFFNNKKISEGKIILAGSDFLERRSSGEVISVLFLKPEIRIENKNMNQIDFSPSKIRLISHIRIILNYKINYSDSPFMNNRQSSDSNSSILKNLLELYKTTDNLNQRSRNSKNHILDYKITDSKRKDYQIKGVIKKYQTFDCSSYGEIGKKYINMKRDVYYKVYKQNHNQNNKEKEYKSKVFNTIDYKYNDKENSIYSIDNQNQYEEIKKKRNNHLVNFNQTNINQKKSILFTSPSKTIRKIKILLIENSNQTMKIKPNPEIRYINLYKEVNDLYSNSYNVLYELNKDLRKRLNDIIQVYHKAYKKVLSSKAKMLFIIKSKCKIKDYNEIVMKQIKTVTKVANYLYEENTLSRYLKEKQIISTVCSELLSRHSSSKNIFINKDMSIKFERFINKNKSLKE